MPATAANAVVREEDPEREDEREIWRLAGASWGGLGEGALLAGMTCWSGLAGEMERTALLLLVDAPSSRSRGEMEEA